MIWDSQQAEVLAQVSGWMKSSDQLFILLGAAGTGKSTLARHLVKQSRRRWLFAAFTGKAAHVMRTKGCEGASTIHSLIYAPAGESNNQEILLLETRIDQIYANAKDGKPNDTEIKEIARLTLLLHQFRADTRPRYQLRANSPLNDWDVEGVVIDECSMVDERIGKDLESFGKKILVLGDQAQLPPVGSGGYFTMRTPNYLLTNVHRQALDSGVIRLATWIREGKDLSKFQSAPDAMVVPKSDVDQKEIQWNAMSADQVLVGRNATRHSANRRHRELLGRHSAGPVPGDRLVCLRNDHALGLYNGSQWTVVDSTCDLPSKCAELTLDSEDDGSARVTISAWLHHMIGDTSIKEMDQGTRRELSEFDWSYALTVHKAQGSQWPNVMILDESKTFGENWRRWLYTAVSRAIERTTVYV